MLHRSRLAFDIASKQVTELNGLFGAETSICSAKKYTLYFLSIYQVLVLDAERCTSHAAEITACATLLYFPAQRAQAFHQVMAVCRYANGSMGMERPRRG